jgi:hypothetical protein
MPSWVKRLVKKVPWILFPLYGYMRRADPMYQEHVARWQDQQRRNYLGDEPQ